MKILIPTCKQRGEIQPLIDSLNQYVPKTESNAVLVSCFPESAAVNRNWCLSRLVVGEVAIMIDDDIEGFYHGWIEDLVKPMSDPNVVMVSARLLEPDGRFGQTCSRCYADSPEEIEVFSNGQCVLPTAAIAFRHRGHMFDCNFLGSGWEDNDWCLQYLADVPHAKFIQSNRCRLIHRNEQKSQGKHWDQNMMYFHNKWTLTRVTA